MLECTLCKWHSAWVFGSKLMCYAISRCSLVVLCYTNLTLVCTIPAHDEEHFLSQLPSAKGTTASTWCFTWQYSVISHHVCNCSLFQYFPIFLSLTPKDEVLGVEMWSSLPKHPSCKHPICDTCISDELMSNVKILGWETHVGKCQKWHESYQ